MIVDDDKAFLHVARAVLERDGVTVAGVAHTCAEAVERAEALRPDVLLIDIRLGEESGFDVARQLAGDGQAATLIMISTNAREDYADLIAESPAAGFVAKADLSAAAIPPYPRGGLTIQGSHRGTGQRIRTAEVSGARKGGAQPERAQGAAISPDEPVQAFGPAWGADPVPVAPPCTQAG